MSTTAETQTTSGIVGHIGLSAGLNSVRDDDADTANVLFGGLDGSITFPVFGSYLVVFDATARYDNFSSDNDYSDAEDPELEYSLGTHVLRQLNDDTRVGFFGGYGDTRTQGDKTRDAYDVWMYGLEAQSFIADNVLIFGQVGYGSKGRSGDNGNEGYEGGFLARFGISYFPDNKSSLTLEIEAAETDSYIDGSDDGEFYGITLSYQRLISDSMPLYFTCFGRYDMIDATTENDSVEEMQVGLGLRYFFGAGSPQEAARKGISIGMPRLPTRASAWTEYLD